MFDIFLCIWYNVFMGKDMFTINKNDLSYGRGYVYSLQYHLVWCTKYRKKVLKDGILELLGLAEKREALPGTLSGGQQQRAAIARALAAKPAIILADEPTGNLDSVTSHDVLGLLKMAARQFSQTLILITHDRDIAQLADRIVHIEDGKIVGDTRKGSDSYA